MTGRVAGGRELAAMFFGTVLIVAGALVLGDAPIALSLTLIATGALLNLTLAIALIRRLNATTSGGADTHRAESG
jgi:hypothetical protein